MVITLLNNEIQPMSIFKDMVITCHFDAYSPVATTAQCKMHGDSSRVTRVCPGNSKDVKVNWTADFVTGPPH